ncbi:sugar ABC transporter substrate-binding protein [Pseudoclavibacter terrae]|uniref:sugar ABC transporter substrate-binding protein n=1 Tax=Pseudoclavibacter terrae TaxID=1530195 RepID=UPI00232ABED5|nr:substrate-binding domain-containing protein [Pseudoclavibacter terrae]
MRIHPWRSVASISALSLAAALLAGCATADPNAVADGTDSGASAEEFVLSPRIVEKVDSGEQLTIVVSAPNTSLAFAAPQRQGVERAAEELGVDARFIGPSDGSADGQINELRTLISQGQVDGIALSAVANDALKPVIAEAFDAGIPLIAYSTDNPGSKQQAFIGTDVAAGGALEATELGKVLQGKTGKVVTFSVAPEAAWSATRFDAFKEALPEGLEVMDPINTGNEPAQMFTAVQNAMAANPDAVAIASMDCCSFTAAAKWVDEFAQGEKPVVVGFDALQQTLDYIDKGVVSFAISQVPSELTYESVKMLRDYLQNDTPLADTTLDLVLVTKDNVDEITPEG